MCGSVSLLRKAHSPESDVARKEQPFRYAPSCATHVPFRLSVLSVSVWQHSGAGNCRSVYSCTVSIMAATSLSRRLAR